MFTYKSNQLYCDSVSLQRIADRYGTPVFVYNSSRILDNFHAYKKAFKSVPHLLCYAVKANSNRMILRSLAHLGGGADIVSGGELYRVLKSGIPPSRIVYAGVGKTDEEIHYALKERILLFNVESYNELHRINVIAKRMKKKAPIAFRVNPDIDAGTHNYITTGRRENKFGIHFPHILEHFIAAKKLSHIDILGIHAHIGSQLLTLQPYVSTIKKLLEVIRGLELLGINLTYIDIGGGMGISYHHELPPIPRDLAKKILPYIRGKKLTLILEPGRSIVGDAGCLVTKVIYAKFTGHKYFIIVDAAMNDLIRPAMYGSYHAILPVVRYAGRKNIIADVVGPICETGDTFAAGRKIREPRDGELLALMAAGAYGFSMSSQYNSRPRAAEIMVKNSKTFLARKRETYQDLINQEMH